LPSPVLSEVVVKLSDELDIRLKTTIEADEQASIKQIKSQIPSIENGLKSTKIKIPVDADASEAGRTIEQSIKQATGSLKTGKKPVVPVDVEVRVGKKQMPAYKDLMLDVENLQAKLRKSGLELNWTDFNKALDTGKISEARKEYVILGKTFRNLSQELSSKLPTHALEALPARVTEASTSIKTLTDNFSILKTQGFEIPSDSLSNLSALSDKLQAFSEKLSKLQPNADVSELKSTLAEFTQITTSIDEMSNAYKSATSTFRREKIELGADAVETDVKRIRQVMLNMLSDWSAMQKDPELMGQWRSLFGVIESGAITSRPQVTALNKEISALRANVHGKGLDKMNFFGQLWANAKKFTSWFALGSGVATISRTIRDVVSSVRDINTALIEMRKVSNATESQLTSFLSNASRRAVELGTTVSNLINSTAAFSRIGYGIDDAAVLGEVATLYYSVGDGLDSIDQASADIISSMKAFNIQATDAITIVDSLNRVGNEFSISSGGIGEALRRSASALAEANNSIEQSIALNTAANNVVQDPEKVGTMWKTVSMRIRGATTELEEAGLETDGMVQSTSELRDLVKGLTGGFDIMLDENTFKSTYDIVLGISEVYDKMTDINQAALLEALAGKRQGNILASAINNADDLVASFEAASDAQGSALQEHERWLDSIEAKQQQAQAQFQAFSNAILDSELVKFTYDAGTGILGFLTDITESVGALPTLAAAAGAALSFKNAGQPKRRAVSRPTIIKCSA
jgi:TP901 family phage tail tape measure protein